MGKSSVNGQFPMAMLNNQMVFFPKKKRQLRGAQRLSGRLRPAGSQDEQGIVHGQC